MGTLEQRLEAAGDDRSLWAKAIKDEIGIRLDDHMAHSHGQKEPTSFVGRAFQWLAFCFFALLVLGQLLTMVNDYGR